MDKFKIIESLEMYFTSASTDYAVLLAGEWGAGKTYFLKNEVFAKIQALGKKWVYVSLIGLQNDVQLEKLIFPKINPFHYSKSKSSASIEADFIESKINGEDKPYWNIPTNIVLCFDDLERIKPEFFESAMGFINLFIEHNKTKCVFLCNEQIIEKANLLQNYKTIKEKYIRFTFSYRSDFKEIINEKIADSSIKNIEHAQIPIVIDVFNKGKIFNLRTLFFALSIYEQVVDEVCKIPYEIQNKDQIFKLILTYCCFYAIESKRGASFDLLDRITINYRQSFWSDVLGNEESTENEKKDFLDNEEEDNPKDDNSKELATIQRRYFNDESLQFERFECVAGLIQSGYLNSEMLKDEIFASDISLRKSGLIQENRKILDIVNNVFAIPDSEVEHNVNFIVEEAEKGKFDLPTYLKLYQELVWLESFNVEGVKISEDVAQKFRDGAKRAVETGNLRYVQNLRFQLQWSNEDKSTYGQKFKKFASYVDSLNMRIGENKKGSEFEGLLKSIHGENHEEFIKLLDKESDLHLTLENAHPIYEALKQTSAKTANHFYTGIMYRYESQGSSISEMPKIEKDFIIKLFELLKIDEKLEIKVVKPLSKVPLIFLKDYLKKLIENRFQVKNA